MFKGRIYDQHWSHPQVIHFQWALYVVSGSGTLVVPRSHTIRSIGLGPVVRWCPVFWNKTHPCDAEHKHVLCQTSKPKRRLPFCGSDVSVLSMLGLLCTRVFFLVHRLNYSDHIRILTAFKQTMKTKSTKTFLFYNPFYFPPLRPLLLAVTELTPFLLFTSLFTACFSICSFLPSLSRMRETSRKNNVFAQFRKTDRDRQKLIDAVIKQLRNLIAQHHT